MHSGRGQKKEEKRKSGSIAEAHNGGVTKYAARSSFFARETKGANLHKLTHTGTSTPRNEPEHFSSIGGCASVRFLTFAIEKINIRKPHKK